MSADVNAFPQANAVADACGRMDSGLRPNRRHQPGGRPCESGLRIGYRDRGFSLERASGNKDARRPARGDAVRVSRFGIAEVSGTGGIEFRHAPDRYVSGAAHFGAQKRRKFHGRSFHSVLRMY